VGKLGIVVTVLMLILTILAVLPMLGSGQTVSYGFGGTTFFETSPAIVLISLSILYLLIILMIAMLSDVISEKLTKTIDRMTTELATCRQELAKVKEENEKLAAEKNALEEKVKLLMDQIETLKMAVKPKEEGKQEDGESDGN